MEGREKVGRDGGGWRDRGREGEKGGRRKGMSKGWRGKEKGREEEGG